MAVFVATKHEKPIMAGSYLDFHKYFLIFELLASNTIKNEFTIKHSWHQSHKKQQNSLKTQFVLLILSFELEISGEAI